MQCVQIKLMKHKSVECDYRYVIIKLWTSKYNIYLFCRVFGLFYRYSYFITWFPVIWVSWHVKRTIFTYTCIWLSHSMVYKYNQNRIIAKSSSMKDIRKFFFKFCIIVLLLHLLYNKCNFTCLTKLSISKRI